MAAELTEHVGYEKHDVAGHNSGNSRNGKSAKTLKGSFGTMPIAVPYTTNAIESIHGHRGLNFSLSSLSRNGIFVLQNRLALR